jgi:hypothetical protein
MALTKRTVAIAGAFVLLLAAATFLALKHSPPGSPKSPSEEANKLPGFELGEELKRKVPGAALPVEAVEFLGIEMERGRLPGLAKGDHVALKLPGSSVMPDGVFQSAFTGAVNYPLIVRVDADVNDEGFLHHYEIERASKNSAWHLRRAWRTDRDGQVWEEFPVR